MQKIVECVPNFSEGRDLAVIEKITSQIETVEGISLLDVDPGKDTNRTVVTFVGSPEAVLEAAFRGIAKAAEVIDMTKQTGAHARHGATDVCPFVPVSGVTMDECVELAKKLGKRVGEELKIPVYLYEEAATKPEWRNLANVRKGEYEALPEKLKKPEWKPDFGPAEFNARSGATSISAREFLIAYNINLNTRDVNIAKDIAFTIREKGRLKRDEKGKIVKDKDGNKLRVPGLFTNCKAVGWYMDDFGRAQISMNLTNYKITPAHEVFDACCKLAVEKGTRVTGSELVGLLPLDSIRQAGFHYLNKQKNTSGVPDAELIHIADLSMGLSDLYPFEKDKKVIEYQMERSCELVSMKVDAFTELLSSDAPAPGGGSVAALCGAMSGALSSMVGALTFGKKGYENVFTEMEEIGVQGQKIKDAFIMDVDKDTDAFNKVMAAMRLPKKTAAEIEIRNAAIQAGNKEATLIPFGVLERSLEAARLARVMVEKGNGNSLSDAGVAALTARTAAIGAHFNVMINLPGIDDEIFKSDLVKKANDLRKEIEAHTAETIKITDAKLAG